MKKTARLAAILLGFAAFSPAVAAAPNSCDDGLRSAEAEETSQMREKPLSVPSEFSALAQLDDTHLKITTVSGRQMCILTDWIFKIADMESFADGRFFGFHYYAMEADGYILIDRAGNGAQLATGKRPYFTSDDTKFVSLQTSGAGWGNLEGLGVWHVSDTSTKRVFFKPTEELGGNLSIRYFDANSNCGLMASQDHRNTYNVGYISFVLTDTIKFDDGNKLDKCIAKMTNQTISEVRAGRIGIENLPADWYIIHEGADPVNSGRPYDLHFADKASIYKSGGYYSVAASHLELIETRANEVGAEIAEYRTRSLIDCDAKRYKILDYIEYDKTATLIMESKHNATTREWLDAKSNSQQGALLKFVCEPNSKIGEQRWPGHIEPRQLIIAMSQADWSK